MKKTTSVEDLFGDKRRIKTESLFKLIRELVDNKEFEFTNDENEIPRLALVQGRAGIGKTTFVHYVAHQWGQGQLYTHYTWVFTLSLRKLRLLPSTPELNLQEWIQQSQFGSWKKTEFDELWQQRIEPAIHQNQVLLILSQLSSMTCLYQIMEKKLYQRSYARLGTEPPKEGEQIIREQTDFTDFIRRKDFF